MCRFILDSEMKQIRIINSAPSKMEPAFTGRHRLGYVDTLSHVVISTHAWGKVTAQGGEGIVHSKVKRLMAYSATEKIVHDSNLIWRSSGRRRAGCWVHRFLISWEAFPWQMGGRCEAVFLH
jgi:hypothetical protein